MRISSHVLDHDSKNVYRLGRGVLSPEELMWLSIRSLGTMLCCGTWGWSDLVVLSKIYSLSLVTLVDLASITIRTYGQLATIDTI